MTASHVSGDADLGYDIYSAERHVKVILLDGNQLFLTYGPNTIVEDVFHRVCESLELVERELFGLAIDLGNKYYSVVIYYKGDGFLFLDPSEVMQKIINHYLDSNMKVRSFSSSTLRLNKQTNTTYPTLYFRVRFYVPIYCIRERRTQHIYFKQIRINILEHNIFCSLDSYIQLAAFALQAEIGDLPVKSNGQLINQSYFKLDHYFPQKVIVENNPSTLERLTQLQHAYIHGMVRQTAELHFIRLASKRISCFNLHLYRLPRMNASHFSAWCGICPEGLTIFWQLKDGWITPSCRFLWSEINHLSYHHHVVKIHLNYKSRKRKLKFKSTLLARHLFALATHMHLFQATAQMSAVHPPESAEPFERKFEEERAF